VTADQKKAHRDYPQLIKEIIAIDTELRALMNRNAVPIGEAKKIRELADRKRELVRAASNIWGAGKREGQGPSHA
jgi:hypothetical protein